MVLVTHLGHPTGKNLLRVKPAVFRRHSFFWPRSAILIWARRPRTGGGTRTRGDSELPWSPQKVTELPPVIYSWRDWVKLGPSQGTDVCQVHAWQIEFNAILNFNFYTLWLFLAFSGGVPCVHICLPASMGEIFRFVKVVLPQAFWAWAGAAHISDKKSS